MRERRSLGETLNLNPKQQEAVVQRQAETGHLFGEAVVELGFASPDQVRKAIDQQQGFSVLSDGDDRVDRLVVTAFDPEDRLARTARNLRSTVTAAVRHDGQPIRSLALVGCDTAAELPIMAANLAVACAQTGLSTLLIDGALDDPHQHALFRVRNRVGLATLLAGNQHGELVQPTAIYGLSLLTAGAAVPNASELFDRQRLANAVELFVEEFGIVLVDAGSDRTAIAAAKGLDAAIIVVRCNVTYTRELRLLADQIKATGQTLLGTVLID
ncbi:Mrp family chromosome partitioning ATPase [Novosphingobium chloroacetimidivorans]|uniref:Mrp family chromosome partitioning ATPase n=1 Tax=Novosphingobium chloroacetimidivorans TaxID=1428314 RepID=A0A7W7NZD2_9SPHN|nr:CpsD/CapB family tyrosine-protein kinase [Novosphingobium chloroacetimidivorans]MBB4861097.1 Mrp family chromosome partitioning ATPase [Novosphingobium chloroacetimidivorans]